MGIVFGRISVEQPKWRSVVKTKDFEVRVLPSCVAASVNEHDTGENGAFRTLASYIGVMSAPQNNGAIPIAMTAPVVKTPILNKDQAVVRTQQKMHMAFLLPAQYQTPETCPAPMDPRVTLTSVAERMIAVRAFSGWVTDEIIAQELHELLKVTALTGIQLAAATHNDFQVAQYNPPFTLPFLRLNEIWVPVTGLSEDGVKKAVEAQMKPT